MVTRHYDQWPIGRECSRYVPNPVVSTLAIRTLQVIGHVPQKHHQVIRTLVRLDLLLEPIECWTTRVGRVPLRVHVPEEYNTLVVIRITEWDYE